MEYLEFKPHCFHLEDVFEETNFAACVFGSGAPMCHVDMLPLPQ